MSKKLETPLEANENGSPTQSIVAKFDRGPLGERKNNVSITKEQKARLPQRKNEPKAFEKEPLSAEDVKSWIALMIRERQPIQYEYRTAKQTSWIGKIALEKLVSHKVIQKSDILADIDKLVQIFNLNLQTESQHLSLLNGLKTNLSMAVKFRVSRCNAIFKHFLKTIESNSQRIQAT